MTGVKKLPENEWCHLINVYWTAASHIATDVFHFCGMFWGNSVFKWVCRGTDCSQQLSEPRSVAKVLKNALKAALSRNEYLSVIAVIYKKKSKGEVMLLQLHSSNIPITFSLFVLLASALFVEDLNKRQRSKCIFYDSMPLVYLPLWGLCIQSKPALAEKKHFFSSCPPMSTTR